MLSRVLRAKPSVLAGVVARRSMHASVARRADFIQDLYSSEIKAFKPHVLTEKDAEGSVLKWAVPAAPKVPSEDLNVSEVDSYSSAPVEVEGLAAAAEGGEAEAATDGDWFPIESFDAQEPAH